MRAAARLVRELLPDDSTPDDALHALDDLAAGRLDAPAAARACAPAVELLDALVVRVTWRALDAAQDRAASWGIEPALPPGP